MPAFPADGAVRAPSPAHLFCKKTRDRGAPLRRSRRDRPTVGTAGCPRACFARSVWGRGRPRPRQRWVQKACALPTAPQRSAPQKLFTLHSSLFVIHFPFPSSFIPDCASPLVVLFLPRSWKVRGSPLSVCCMLSKSLSIRTLGSFRKSFSAYFTGTESFYGGPKVGWEVASGRVNNE